MSFTIPFATAPGRKGEADSGNTSYCCPREREFQAILRITERINAGMDLDGILQTSYEDLSQIIPYNRIGLSLIDDHGETVVARWARSDRPILLSSGFSARLEGSSLEQILRSLEPRILNDLEDYLATHPDSESTRLIVEEGMRSSLTCPLIVRGRPIGFMFFSSVEKNAYGNAHVAVFQQIAGQLAGAVERGRLYAELTLQKAMIDRQNRAMFADMTLARSVQEALLPDPEMAVPGLEVAFDYRPVEQTGGDLLDVTPLPDGRVLLMVGDAVGHGSQGALIMASTKAALHAAIQHRQPGDVLAAVNRVLARILLHRFVTATCCVVSPAEDVAEFSSAGHPPPLLYRASNGSAQLLNVPSGMPLGVRADAEYESGTLPFSVGDVLLLCTDGILEARNAARESFGERRLLRLLRKLGTEQTLAIRDGIVRAVAEHVHGVPREDDMTLLVARRVSCFDAGIATYSI